MVQDIGLSKFIGQSFAGAGAGGHVTDFRCGGSDMRTEEGNVKQERRRGYGESYGRRRDGGEEGQQPLQIGGGKEGSLRQKEDGRAGQEARNQVLRARVACRIKGGGGYINSRNLRSAAAAYLWKTFLAATSRLKLRYGVS
jgi:hypothetical protein